jgi:hypothetical protein
MDRCVGAAARLPESDRKDLAVQALARSATISDLSSRHGVSRKFVYQQARKARLALDDAFISTATDDTVLFQVQVTKRWLRQVIIALALMCRGSYLGIIEFMRDLLGESSTWAAFTTCSARLRSRPGSTAARICRAFAPGCTMNFSTAECLFWLASVPNRPPAISWPRSRTAMPTVGACLRVGLPIRCQLLGWTVEIFLKHDVACAFPSPISITPCSRRPGRDAPAHRAGAATQHPGHRLRAALCHSAGRDEETSAGVERRDDCLYALAVIPCWGLNSSRRCSRTQATPSSRSATPRRARP